ncbi:class B sortase [Alloscardovia venturai]|uniref:Class B sortase n=1 Tax=Alloscardovia venturai TaxID=1769421 RepID=A0ABW2Y411_9BIFI
MTQDRKSTGKIIVKVLDSIISNILLILAALLFLLGFYALWDSQQVYAAASPSEYESYKPQAQQGKDPLETFTGFKQLQKRNPDVMGWINIYGTNVDYPVVQGHDNEKYINTDALGEYSATGALFLDSRNSKNFDDFNSIIYGHHVDSGVMFGHLSRFMDKKFFDSHKYGSIYYNGKQRGLEIFGVMEVDAYDGDIYNPGIRGDAQRMQYLSNILAHTAHKRDISVGPHDSIVLLSTCYLNATNGRHIVLAKITDKVHPNTFKKVNNDPFPYNVFGDSTFGRLLRNIPLWVWYFIIFILILIIVLLLIVLYRATQRKRARDKELADDKA